MSSDSSDDGVDGEVHMYRLEFTLGFRGRELWIESGMSKVLLASSPWDIIGVVVGISKPWPTPV